MTKQLYFVTIISAAYLCCFGCSSPSNTEDAQQKHADAPKASKTTEISCSIVFAKEEQCIILQSIESLQPFETVTIDTLSQGDDKMYNYQGNLEANLYQLVVGKKTIQLAIDQGQKIHISADMNHFDSSLTVSGSQDTDLLKAYDLYRKQLLQELVYPVRAQIAQLSEGDAPNKVNQIKILGQQEIHNGFLYRSALIDFIDSAMGTSVAIYATSSRWTDDAYIPKLKGIVEHMKTEHPTWLVVNKLEAKLSKLATVAIGSEAPNIQELNTNKSMQTLNPQQAKYTLIDFWASWCPPCRREREVLSDVYKKYKRQGLEIFGVSLDKSKEAWLKAIKLDNREWINTCSFEGYNTNAAKTYNITSIPANFLIDNTGRIIAKHLHGDALVSTLDSLFAPKLIN